MGQRTFMIGSSCGRIWLFPRPLGIAAAFRSGRRSGSVCFGCAVGAWRPGAAGGIAFGGRRLVLVGLGAALVRFAAVIRLIKTGAFENNGRPTAQQAPQLGLL